MKQKEGRFYNPRGCTPRIPKDIAVVRPLPPRQAPWGRLLQGATPRRNKELVTPVQHVLELGSVHVTVGMGALFWELCYLAKLKSCPKDQGLPGFLGKTNLICELGINESET